MPYEAKADGENWIVINSDTKDVKGTHTPPDAEKKAQKQVELLNAIEKDPQWEAENG